MRSLEFVRLAAQFEEQIQVLLLNKVNKTLYVVVAYPNVGLKCVFVQF